MSGFIVSARKYRPSRFGEMLGQESISSTLSNSILQGKVAHAYLFCGPRGVGKTSAARIFAKTVNCLHLQQNGEACNECESCRSINEQRSFNLFELDAASNNSADDIRKINEDVYIRPQYGRYKVYIIDEVHMLSSAAFNAFLKTLEEPPAYVIFVLATTEKNKVLPTILSRCQVFDFKPIPPQTISEQLHRVAQSEQVQFESRALDLIARVADGGMRDALSIFDRIVSASNGNVTYERTLSGLNILDDEYYFTLINFLFAGNYKSALLLLDELLTKGENGKTIILGLADFLRNLLVAQSVETQPLFKYTGADAVRFSELAQRCNPLLLYKAMDKLVNCDRNYRNSNSKRLLIELTLINIAEMAGGFQSVPSQPGSSSPVVGGRETIALSSSNIGTTEPTPTVVSQSQRQIAVSEEKQLQSPATQSISVPNLVSTGTSLPNSTPPPKGGGSRIALKRIRKVEEPEKEIISTEDNLDNAPHTPLEQESLSILWNKYAEEKLSTEIYLRQTMQSGLPKVVSSDVFSFSVLNEIQKNELLSAESELLQYLRLTLNNQFLTMNVEIDDTPVSNKPIATQDKIDHLNGLNGSVQNFIEALSLKPL